MFKTKCAHCGKELVRRKISKSNLYFCNRECHMAEQCIGGKLQPAHYGTKKVIYKKKKRVRKPNCICAYCKKSFYGSRNNHIYCSRKCANLAKKDKYIEKWKRGLVTGTYNGAVKNVSRYVKSYLLKKYNNQCARCNISDWHGQKLILELHHKDGNSRNNTEENLEYLCPNCHSVADKENKGNKPMGRRYYREKYRDELKNS